jgi:hypothetical protein
MGFGLVTGFSEHYRTLTTNNYNSLTQLHTAKITVTVAHIMSSQSSLAIAWQWLPMADIPLPLGSETVLSISYQLLTSHSCNSQRTLNHQLRSRSQSYFMTGPLRLMTRVFVGNTVSTELFSSNGCCTVTCLNSCYLTMGLYATIL